MVPAYPLSTSRLHLIEQAAVPLQVGPAFYSGLLLGALGIGVWLLYQRNPQVFNRLIYGLQRFLFPRGQRYEARLERVICFACNRGKGVFDPVYLTLEGENYVEGVCSCCGNFVRAKLR